MKIEQWTSKHKAKRIEVCTPCPCGCDHRGEWKGPGYLLVQNGTNGATIFCDTIEEFAALVLAITIYNEGSEADDERT